MLFSTFDSKTTERPWKYFWPYLLTTKLKSVIRHNLGHSNTLQQSLRLRSLSGPPASKWKERNLRKNCEKSFQYWQYLSISLVNFKLFNCNSQYVTSFWLFFLKSFEMNEKDVPTWSFEQNQQFVKCTPLANLILKKGPYQWRKTAINDVEKM